MKWCWGLWTTALVAAGPLPAEAHPWRSPNVPLSSPQTYSALGSPRSVGRPWRGRLYASRRLKDSRYIRLVEHYRDRGYFWGTNELISLIERSAMRVARRHGPGRLAVGELSRRSGGRVTGHRSHQNGRDVDLGFYLRWEDGDPATLPSFIYLTRKGTRRIGEDRVGFDLPRNWTLVESLITDEHVAVQHIFVAKTIRRLLLRYAESIHVPPTILERARHMMRPPGSGKPHTDHFHVRIYCSTRDRSYCRDKGPYWPWSAALHRKGSQSATSQRP